MLINTHVISVTVRCVCTCVVRLQVSKAAYGLCCWVRAMEVYDRVAKVVGPKKEALKQAETQLQVSINSAPGELLPESFASSC